MALLGIGSRQNICKYENPLREGCRSQTSVQAVYLVSNTPPVEGNANPPPAANFAAATTKSTNTVQNTRNKPSGYQYCHTHGINQTHESKCCLYPAEGHVKEATMEDMKGGNTTVFRPNVNNYSALAWASCMGACTCGNAQQQRQHLKTRAVIATTTASSKTSANTPKPCRLNTCCPSEGFLSEAMHQIILSCWLPSPSNGSFQSTIESSS